MKRGQVLWLAAWSLLAGAAINALLAQVIGCFGGDVFAKTPAERYLPVAGRCVKVDDRAGAGWRALLWWIYDVDDATDLQYMHDHGLVQYARGSAGPVSLRPDSPATLPAWAYFWKTDNWIPDVRTPGGSTVVPTVELAVGWPFLSFSKDGDNRANIVYRGGTVFNRANFPAVAGFTWRPIFPGVLWGSLFWAAACAAGFSGVRAIVRARRRRRSRCADCGYDLRGLAAGAVCPECGGGPGAGKVSG